MHNQNPWKNLTTYFVVKFGMLYLIRLAARQYIANYYATSFEEARERIIEDIQSTKKGE